MQLRQNSPRLRTFLALLPLFLLILVLVPILWVGSCAHPFGDDLGYSVYVHQALEGDGSLLSALLYTVRRIYFGWQGTFSSIVLMALQPGIWSEEAYILTPIIMLAMVIVPTALLTHTLLCRWLKRSWQEWLAFTCVFLLITILFQPSVMQAFFWWNGAVFYTFCFGLLLLLVHCVIRLRLHPKHPRLLMAAALVLAMLIGGGNYVTGLFACLLGAGYTLLCLLWDRPRLRHALPVTVSLILFFLINTLAPGNAVRQATSAGMGLFPALKASLLQVLTDTLHWLDLAHIGFFLCLIPLFWRILEGTKFRFPLPAAVTVLLFLALASQNMPHFFALAEEGPGRLRNIVYDCWLWLLCLGEAYWIGWLRRVWSEKKAPLLTSIRSGVLVCLGAVLMITGCLHPLYSTGAGQCILALKDGSAYSYDAQINRWVEQLSAEGEDTVVCSALTEFPPLLHLYNLTDNPDNFANIAAANYYGKRAVIALPAQSLPPDEKE